MKKTNRFTKTLAIFLTVLMLLSVAPFGELAGLDLGFKLKADAVFGYSAGGAAEWAKQHYKDHDSVLLGTGYWDDGGDCANFVSQCLYMGGIDMDGYWNTTGYLAHWSEPYGYDYAGSFIRCVQLYNYLVYQKGGEVIHNPAASQVDIGDVLIYYRSEVGRFGHSAIVTDIVGGVPEIAYHSVGWEYNCYTNWHLGFTGDQTYLIKLHGSVCVNQRTRSVDVYRYAWGDAWLYWAPNGDRTNQYYISNDYALVDEIRYDGSQYWGHTMLDAVWGWVPLKYFTFMGHYDTPTVSHNFGAWQTLQVANCQQDGLDKRVCTRCGYTETRTTKGGHITDPHATCTTEGFCKVCGAVTEAPLGHLWDAGRICRQPTCTEPGDIRYYCERDRSHQYVDVDAAPALGHDYQAVPTAPTCVQDGITTYACSRCGDSFVTYTDEENTWSGWTDQTPEEVGLSGDKVRTTTQYRSRTKSTTTSSYPELEGWTYSYTTTNYSDYGPWSDWSRTPVESSNTRKVETREVSTTQYNYSRYAQYSNNTGIVGPVAGYWGSPNMVYCQYYFERGWSSSNLPIYMWQDSNQAGTFACFNNADDGWFNETTRQVDQHTEYRYCDRTIESYTYHYYKWSDWSAWQEEPITVSWLQQNSKEVETRTAYSYDLAALGHDFSVQQEQAFIDRDLLLTDEQVNDVCYTYGYTCSRCGAAAPDNISTSHDIPDFETERDQYEIVSGDDASVTVYKGLCRNGCGCYVLKTVDNHNYVVKEIVSPTCNGEHGTEGYTVYRCTYHGEEYNDDYVPALEDDYSHDIWEVQTSPTCTQPGVRICKCARYDACGHYITEEIPSLGHTLTKFEAKPATCLLDGNSEYYYCAGCDKYFADEAGTAVIEEDSWIIPATGHSDPDDVEWTVETQRKCGSAGYERKYCENEWCDLKHACDICGEHGIHGAVLDERETEPIPAVYYVFKAEYAEYDPTIESDNEFEKWVPTTCDHYGKLYVTCRNCEGTEDAHGFPPDKPYSIILINPLPHLPVERIDPEPLCIYPGVKHTDCERCGKQDIVEPEEIPAPYSEHDMEERQDEGCIYHVCTRCGYSPDTDAHDYQRDTSRDLAPTCTTEGNEGYTCTRCGKQEDKTLPALGHDMVKTGELPATCTEGAADVYECQREGCDYTFEVPTGQPLGHDYSGSYFVTQKGTCTEDGRKALHCVRENARTGEICDAELSWLTIPARGHDMSEWIDDSASGEDACRRMDCRNTETEEYEVCSFNITEQHSWGDWTDNGENHIRTCLNIASHLQTQAHTWTKTGSTDADCTNSGSISYRCDICGAEKTEPVNPNGHTLVKTDAVPASCLEDGNDAYYTCSVCGKYFSDEDAQNEIAENSWLLPALGHDWGDWEETAAATYDACGEETRICKRDASHIETRPTPVLMPDNKDNTDITVEKTADYNAETGEAIISLSAESKGEKIMSKDETPLDIVLVLDQSGSMAYRMDKNENPYHNEKTRLAELKTAATEFIDTIAARKTDDRIAVVGFAMGATEPSGYTMYENTEILSLETTKTFSPKPSDILTMNAAYKNAMVSVVENGEVNALLTKAINELSARGATAADLGLIMAGKIFEQNPNDDGSRRRVVVFMTDGEPTYSNGFQPAVAEYAESNAALLKNAYDATVYSVGVIGGGLSADGKAFLREVASENSKNEKLYYSVTDGGSFLECFKSIAEDSGKVENSFDDVTLVDTLTKEFTLTETQEKTLRLNAIETLGVTNNDVTILRLADGTTQIRIAHIHPQEEKRDGESYFPVRFSFAVTANENALRDAEYATNTDNAGVGIGDETSYETTFQPYAVTVEAAEGVVYFNLNGKPFHAVRFHAGDNLTAPTLTLEDTHTFSGWNIPEPLVFTDGKVVLEATIEQRDYTVTWQYDGNTKTDTYNEGDIITPPQVGLNSEGQLFDSWNQPVPRTMPASDLCFTATFVNHTHVYTETVVKRASCGVEGKKLLTCDCGSSKEETIPALTHSYTTFATENASGKTNFAYVVCENCGLTMDVAFTYTFEDASGKIQGCNLKMTDLNNATVQIENDQLRITLPIPTQMLNAETVKIYRIEEDGSKTDLNATMDRRYRTLRFTTNHFSPYSIEAAYACETTGAHSWDAGVVTKEATCAADGETTYTCLLCEGTKKEPIGKLTHTPGDWIIDKAATCKEAGSKHQICSACRQTIATQTIPTDKNNHAAYGTTLKNKVDAKCTTKGYTGDTVCNGCGTVITKGSETKALGHTAPNSKGDCDRCGTHLKDVDSGSSTPAGACKYCGQVHTGPFGWLIKFFHSILALFGLRK